MPSTPWPPQELIMILAVKWFRLSLSVFFLFLKCSLNGSAQLHKTIALHNKIRELWFNVYILLPTHVTFYRSLWLAQWCFVSTLVISWTTSDDSNQVDDSTTWILGVTMYMVLSVLVHRSTDYIDTRWPCICETPKQLLCTYVCSIGRCQLKWLGACMGNRTMKCPRQYVELHSYLENVRTLSESMVAINWWRYPSILSWVAFCPSASSLMLSTIARHALCAW